MIKNPITQNGFNNLKKKLDFLKNIERIKIINDIKTARGHGDLKENAEYHAAKEAQFILERKIRELEEKIITSQIIEPDKNKTNNLVSFGSTVKLINLDNNKEYSYNIVGEDETDIKNNKISIKSPLAKALIQKSSGDIINVKLPNGKTNYKIIEIT